MKTTFKNCYVIISPSGYLIPQSIREWRKDCINSWLEEYATWEEAKNLGWKCLKVNVNFEIV